MTAPQRVLFVCLHGSAKSVIAAEHLRRLAAERGRTVASESAGVEPDDELPPHVVAGLRADGLDVVQRRPRAFGTDLVRGATIVVTMGCDLPASSREGSVPVVRWDDVPAVSDGYDAARDDIVRRLTSLLERLT